MLDKIRFKKVWFVLLVLPLVFTPVFTPRHNGNHFYNGLTIGPHLAFPIPARYGNWVRTIDFQWRPDSLFKSLHYRTESPEDTFVDWGRIAYWEAWMLTICFVVNRKRLMAKEIS
jgi:hypothetical protein